MIVPFHELKRESVNHSPELEQAVARVVQSGRYVLGPELNALEMEFADFLQVSFAAGVASGTDALTLAIQATGLIEPQAGHEILTTALTAGFTALAICRAGAVPRFVDIDPATLQIDADAIESCLTDRTRALLPVHLYGQSCAMDKIRAIADGNDLAVIEDACQAHGSSLDGRALGTMGRAGAFSFYPTKNLGALGDGGMVVTGDQEIYERVKKLRHGGQDRTFHHELTGFNSRLDEIQAAVLRVKLKTLEARNEARRRLALRYDQAFADVDVQALPASTGLIPNRHLYPVRTRRRDELQGFLNERGIETQVHYPLPMPMQAAFRRFVLPGQTFPAAEKAAGEILSLPLYPELTRTELEYTIETVRRFFNK